MFGRRNRKMKNDTGGAMVIPQPRQGPPVYTQPARPSYVGLIFALFACLVMSAPGIWFIGVFLFDKIGVRDPDRAFAGVLLLVIIGLPLLASLSWLISSFRAQTHAHLQVMRQMDLEAMRYTSITAGTPALANERLTEEDKKLFENLSIVMEQAYRDFAEKGEYRGGNDPRPWSQASVLSLNPPRHGRMSYMKAGRVREWLEKHRVIIGEPQKDQINIEQFPAFADFQALLEDKFNMPVVVNPPQLGNGLIGRYAPIEQD